LPKVFALGSYWIDRSYSISRSGLFRVWRADGGKLLQNVGVGFQTRRRTLIFRQKGEAVIDDVVREDATVGVLCRLGRIETQHVGKGALRVDGCDRFFACVVAGMPKQVHEHL